MSLAKTRAINLLTHYMRHAWTSAGVGWDSDNESEVAGIVDAIEAMVDDMIDRAVQAHGENSPHIYADGSTS